MMRTLWALAVLAAIAVQAAEAQSQQVDPIVGNYRAYTAALQRGDMAAAEAPAAAALSASQAQFGESHRTPVLALNLARLRLGLGKAAEAQEPAALAFRLAQQQGAVSGVDTLMAEITVARAEFGGDPRRGNAHLRAVLLAANARSDLDADAYAGAMELGGWAHTSEHYDIMRIAYEVAVSHAAGAPDNVALARGVARAAVGTAIILGLRGPNRSAMREAYATLTQAMRELWPLAQQDGANGELSIGQVAFARALAWQALAYAQGRSDAVDGDVQNQIGGDGCHYHLDHAGGDHASFYPPRARNREEEGIVVVHAVFDDTGHTTRVQTAAAAPETAFSTAAESLVRTLVVVRNPNSAPNCVMPRQRFISVRFAVG